MPKSEEIKKSYTYTILKDRTLTIKFRAAENGDCYFKSSLDIETPRETKDAILYKPEILV